MNELATYMLCEKAVNNALRSLRNESPISATIVASKAQRSLARMLPGQDCSQYFEDLRTMAADILKRRYGSFG